MKTIFALLFWTIIVQTATAQDYNYIVPIDTQLKNLSELTRNLTRENASLKQKVATLEYVVAVSDTLIQLKDARLSNLSKEADDRITGFQHQYENEKQLREKLESDNRRLADDNKRILDNTTGSKIIAMLAVIGTIAAILVR